MELVQTELPVGPYYLDILAKNPDTGVLVAIENQLEETDHSHLGQLLTYASGQGVGVAVWVAPEFGYEHAQALDQLNRWTGDGIRFYGVKVEVIKNPANSELDARFHTVVYPGGWNKDLTRQAWEMPLTTRRYYDFFQPLINEMYQKGFSNTPRQRWGRTGRQFPSPVHSGIWYEAYMATNHRVSVTLHIEMETPEQTKRVFDALKERQEEIESSIPFHSKLEWDWNRFDPYGFSCVNVWRDGSIDDPPEKLDEIRDWMLDLLPKFRQVFEPILADVLK